LISLVPPRLPGYFPVAAVMMIGEPVAAVMMIGEPVAAVMMIGEEAADAILDDA
jgi:hypothetical protein